MVCNRCLNATRPEDLCPGCYEAFCEGRAAFLEEQDRMAWEALEMGDKAKFIERVYEGSKTYELEKTFP